MLYIDKKPVLHVIDTATAFNGARFLKSLSATDTWETLRMLWIDTYQGPPDILTHDAGTNFASREFQSEAQIMGITCKQVPVEAHWSIGKVERYHAPLRRAYDILRAELPDQSPEAVLQMAVKAVNDTIGPDGLVPTLLVFGAYPRMTMESPPSPGTRKRGEAIAKAMKSLRALQADRMVRAAAGMRNSKSVLETITLPLNSEVLVWREKEGWTGPFRIVNSKDHDITVDKGNGLTATFRSSVVKPYYRRDQTKDAEGETREVIEVRTEEPPPSAPPEPGSVPTADPPRRRGRPRGAKNKQRPTVYMTKKEEDDYQLALKLRSDGVINEPGFPFETSDQKEIDDLIGRGVFEFVRRDMQDPSTRIFKSRMVREVKGKTLMPYEKSRLVVRGYNDHEKKEILTQSPTIQRCSQRLLIALAPTLMKKGMSLQLRDITQAYPQSQTRLTRTILAFLPRELEEKLPEGTIMHIVKPLYGIAEAGVHWFVTYQGHHMTRLGMITSTFDPCLLITETGDDPGYFSITALQTDDTLSICSTSFAAAEERALEETKFRAKDKTTLEEGRPLEFNGCTLTKDGDVITITQKGQGAKIRTIDPIADNASQQYAEQRARGSYIASICQPQASFPLSIAAQVREPESTDHKALNKTLQWQIDNQLRGITMVPLDLTTCKLMIFTDASFANLEDMGSQLGYLVTLVNEFRKGKALEIRGNVVHWSSTKCKRVVRSALASETLGMSAGADIATAVWTTLRLITERLGLPQIPLIICTDSYSLYECLVKLGTMSEKRLMIDIMALRQSYERREISEIRWINGGDNPADALTKSKPNGALTHFIDTNELTIRVEGSVARPTETSQFFSPVYWD